MDSEFKKIVDKAIGITKEKQERFLIDVLTDIYKQKYSNYQEYYDEMKKINDDVRKENKDNYSIFYMNYIPIVSERIFNYTKSKGHDDYMARETIRILRKKSTLSIDLKFATEEEKEIIYATLLGDENV